MEKARPDALLAPPCHFPRNREGPGKAPGPPSSLGTVIRLDRVRDGFLELRVVEVEVESPCEPSARRGCPARPILPWSITRILVGVANGGEAMGDDEGRAALHQL